MTKWVERIKGKIQSNPKGLYVLFYTEMWELFGRFGITALLVFYLTNTFHLSDSKAFAIYSGFIVLIYVMPIIGGFLSDRCLGLRQAIIFGALLMSLGNALLIIPKLHFVFVGLSIVAVGSGFFLPSIVPLVGRLYQADREGRDAGFTLYYIGKNIGALLAPLLCGLVAKYFSYNYAFILSTLGMISGTIIFILGQKHLRDVTQVEEEHIAKKVKVLRSNNLAVRMLVYLIAVILVPVATYILGSGLDGYLLAFVATIVAFILIYLAFKHDMQVKKHLLAIVLMMVFVVLFLGLLGQGGTTLNLFIERIVDRHIFGWQLPASFFYTLDPLFMILCGPFIAGFWLKLSRQGRQPSEVIKFALAMLFLALGFAVFVGASHQAMAIGSASAWFVVLGYFLFPIAELCIMPIGLSLLTALSPKNYDALMVGIWMLGYAASGYITQVVSDRGRVNFSLLNISEKVHAAKVYAHVFFTSTAILVVSCACLLLLLPVYRYLVKRPVRGEKNEDQPANFYY
jgi:proton-dependent oligopeptide transporter, POT family